MAVKSSHGTDTGIENYICLMDKMKNCARTRWFCFFQLESSSKDFCKDKHPSHFLQSFLHWVFTVKAQEKGWGIFHTWREEKMRSQIFLAKSYSFTDSGRTLWSILTWVGDWVGVQFLTSWFLTLQTVIFSSLTCRMYQAGEVPILS